MLYIKFELMLMDGHIMPPLRTFIQSGYFFTCLCQSHVRKAVTLFDHVSVMFHAEDSCLCVCDDPCLDSMRIKTCDDL